MISLHQKMKEEIALRAVVRFWKYMTVDSKVIALIWNFCCDLYIIGNHCDKYEHPRSKHESWVWVSSRRQVLSICDLDILLKAILVNWNLCCNLHTISNHCAKYDQPSTFETFCCTLLYVHSSIAIILMGKRELVALLNLSSWCLVMVERLFLAVPRGCLRFVIVVFPDHTHLLIFISKWKRSTLLGQKGIF